MKLYTIKAIYDNKEYFLSVSHEVDDHTLDSDLSMEEEKYIGSYGDEVFFTTKKEKLEELINHFKNGKDVNYKLDQYTCTSINCYSYIQSFEIIEVTI